MALTQEMKVMYAGIIQKFYDGAVQAKPEDITPEVANVVDQMLNAVKDCSQAYLAADAMFSIFYGKPFLSAKDLLEAVQDNALDLIDKWYDVMYNNRRYRTCVVATAAQWRSPLQIALMGI